MPDALKDTGMFAVDEAQATAKEVIETVIGGNSFEQSKINEWSNAIVENTLAQLLSKHSKAFKYIVTCVLMQKNGAGLNTAASCYWDNATDGSCIVRWENKAIHCIVQIFGVAI